MSLTRPGLSHRSPLSGVRNCVVLTQFFFKSGRAQSLYDVVPTKCTTCCNVYSQSACYTHSSCARQVLITRIQVLFASTRFGVELITIMPHQLHADIRMIKKIISGFITVVFDIVCCRNVFLILLVVVVHLDARLLLVILHLGNLLLHLQNFISCENRTRIQPEPFTILFVVGFVLVGVWLKLSLRDATCWPSDVFSLDHIWLDVFFFVLLVKRCPTLIEVHMVMVFDWRNASAPIG